MTYHWPANIPYDAEVQAMADIHLEEMAEVDPFATHEPMPGDEDGTHWICKRWSAGLREHLCSWSWPREHDVTCPECGRAESVHVLPCASFEERQAIAVAAGCQMVEQMMEGRA